LPFCSVCSWSILTFVVLFIRADNLQRVLLVVGSCHLWPWVVVLEGAS
jgi:hypothetical protein